MKNSVISGSILWMMGVLLLLSSHPIIGPTEAFGQSRGKVLMIPREGYSQDFDLMIKMEIGVMNILLKRAGFEVDIATTSGYPILGHTEKIEKVLRLSEVNLNDYLGIIMPCMAVGMFPGPPVAPLAMEAARKNLADEKPVAAAAHSSTILAEAGLLKGKRYAYVTDPLKTTKIFTRTDPRFEGGIYSGPGVVQDGKIITSAICPMMERAFAMQNGTVELTQKFIAAIGPK